MLRVDKILEGAVGVQEYKNSVNPEYFQRYASIVFFCGCILHIAQLADGDGNFR